MELNEATVDDHWKRSRLLDLNKREYYTNRLQKDNTLRVVIRNIPMSVEIKDFEDNGIEKGFDILMFCPVTKRTPTVKIEIPLIFVELSRNEVSGKILNLPEIFIIRVRFETQCAGAQITQCYRCQLFWHTQHDCHFALCCMKCGQNYVSADS